MYIAVHVPYVYHLGALNATYKVLNIKIVIIQNGACCHMKKNIKHIPIVK